MAASMQIMAAFPIKTVLAALLRRINSFRDIQNVKVCKYATISRISTDGQVIINGGMCHAPKTVSNCSAKAYHGCKQSESLKHGQLFNLTKDKQSPTFSTNIQNEIVVKRFLLQSNGSRGYSRITETTDNNGTSGDSLVLGIETSCDDTGAAVVDQNGRVVGEALNSQTRIHTEMGGIIPYVARDLHRQNIEDVVQAALRDASVSLKDLDAIACTVKPGLLPSLEVGSKYAKMLVKESGKPFIPIHHMEAHALTVRMMESLSFPFLVLLASGGHCLLAVAQNVDDFLLLGTSLDDAPGDAYDKTARTLKLKNLTECAGLSGGAAIERLARGGDPHAFPLTTVMTQTPSCDFSFAGLKERARLTILAEEAKHGRSPVDVLPNAADVCATFQYHVLHHIAKRVQRALLFCEMKQLLPRSNKTMVVSGGVGSNLFLREGLKRMCAEYDCSVVCPPPHLCTDNGIMIAWNGMEKWKVGRGIVSDAEAVQIQAKSPLGQDIREEVANSSIKLKAVKLI